MKTIQQRKQTLKNKYQTIKRPLTKQLQTNR